MASEPNDVLELIKELVVHLGLFRHSGKVQGYIEAGYYGLADLSCCIAMAKRIEKSEKDTVGDSWDGRTYTIIGRDTHGCRFYTCGKIKEEAGMRFYFFMTAHEAD